MKPHQEKTAWLIGASSGMGLETARLLAKNGWKIVISARESPRLLQACKSTGASAVVLDITHQEQVKEASLKVFTMHQPSLVLVNAGDYHPMQLQEFDIALFEQLNRVNYLGVVYLLNSLLPLMRDQGGGEIIVNTSAAAYRGLPGGAPYSAPKAATLNLMESLQPEARNWNIRLRVINPGFVRSKLTSKNQFTMPAIIEPDEAAKKIFNAIGKTGFEISFPRRFTWLLKVLRCAPYRLYFALSRRLVKTHE